MRLAFEPKSAGSHLSVPEPPLAALEAKATAMGIPYSRYVHGC